MDKEFLKELEVELAERISKANERAKDLVVEKQYDDLIFVHIGGKEYINPNILPFEVHFQIIALVKFIREFNLLTNKDIVAILNSREEFQHLRDVPNRIPNLVEYIAKVNCNDEKQIPYFYANQIYFDKKTKKDQCKKTKAKKVKESIEKEVVEESSEVTV